jgi:hypothetical protein
MGPDIIAGLNGATMRKLIPLSSGGFCTGCMNIVAWKQRGFCCIHKYL